MNIVALDRGEWIDGMAEGAFKRYVSRPRKRLPSYLQSHEKLDLMNRVNDKWSGSYIERLINTNEIIDKADKDLKVKSETVSKGGRRRHKKKRQHKES